MNRKANPWVALVALMLLATILVCISAGCGADTDETEETNAKRFVTETRENLGYGEYAKIITDTETTVQYLIVSYGQGIGVTVLQPAPEKAEEAKHDQD